MQKNLSRVLVFFLALTLLTGKLSFAIAAVGQRHTMIFGTSGSVLGDDDSDDSEADEDEQEREEEDTNEQEQEQEREREQERVREQHDEDEQDEDEQDEQEQEASHTEETIKNANGTTTLIKRESDSEKTEVELKTYNSSGKLIEERKLKQETENGEAKEIELDAYVKNNGVLQELKVKSSLGKELEITLREGEQTEEITSKIEYDPTEQELKITDEAQSRALVITPEGDHFLLDDGVQSAEVELPITVDRASGGVFVETAVGLIRVAISPDRALEIIKEKDANLDFLAGSISLEEGGNGLEYRIKTEKRAKLFGLFPVTVDAVEGVDAEVGTLNSVQQDLASRLLDMFSI